MDVNKQFYTNADISHLFNAEINEYDIVQAGLTALYHLGEIDTNAYIYWKRQNKEKTVRYIGKYLSSTMRLQNTCITSVVDKFIAANNIPNNHIISKKRDALFVYNTPIRECVIDEFIFACKNTYSSYLRINTFELYYNRKNNTLSIKGILDIYVKQHSLLPYILRCMSYFEQLHGGFISYKEVYRFIHTYCNMYRDYKLPIDCYRELGNQNMFAVYDTVYKTVFYVDTLSSINASRYNIILSHNYTKFISPFISLLSSSYRI